MMVSNEIVLDSKTATKKMIFVFHGFGADGEDLLPIAENFSNSIEDAEIRLPDGIQECGFGCGLQWFPLAGDLNNLKSEYYEVADILEAYIDNAIQKKGLTNKDVILTGFSQGGMISLMLGLKLEVSAIISFSGLLLDPDIRIKNNSTKILMTHGKLDTRIPISAMYQAETHLKNAGLDVQTIVSEETAHGIDTKMLHGATDFLRSLKI